MTTTTIGGCSEKPRTRAEELQLIADANGGTLTPEAVVDFASDPETALHSAFEWDDTEAARLYRLEQAEKVIRVTVTIIERPQEPPIRVRAFVSLSTDRKDSGVYRRIEDVMADDHMNEILLADAMRELSSLKKKYAHLQRLRKAWDVIEELEREM